MSPQKIWIQFSKLVLKFLNYTFKNRVTLLESNLIDLQIKTTRNVSYPMRNSRVFSYPLIPSPGQISTRAFDHCYVGAALLLLTHT